MRFPTCGILIFLFSGSLCILKSYSVRFLSCIQNLTWIGCWSGVQEPLTMWYDFPKWTKSPAMLVLKIEMFRCRGELHSSQNPRHCDQEGRRRQRWPWRRRGRWPGRGRWRRYHRFQILARCPRFVALFTSSLGFSAIIIATFLVPVRISNLVFYAKSWSILYFSK